MSRPFGAHAASGGVASCGVGTGETTASRGGHPKRVLRLARTLDPMMDQPTNFFRNSRLLLLRSPGARLPRFFRPIVVASRRWCFRLHWHAAVHTTLVEELHLLRVSPPGCGPLLCPLARN